MKKVLTFILAVAMVVSMVGCGEEKEALKMGMGVYGYTNAGTDADADTNGAADVVATVAAVLVDSEGKIVQCELDTVEVEAAYTSDGKYVASNALLSKYDQGSIYGMVAYGGATKEWYEQADAFEDVVVGKTISEVKALVVDGYAGNDEVIKAGCTIGISDFVGAVDKAVANVADSSATAEDTLQLGVVVSQNGSDATEEAAGENEVDTTFAAVAVNKDGKIVDMSIDVLAAVISFDAAGAYTGNEGTTELQTKRELGNNYNMAAYGADLNGDGEVKEWFEQADAFEDACIGKDEYEILTLENDEGYGVEDVQKAGCTIGITEMVNAAFKAAGNN